MKHTVIRTSLSVLFLLLFLSVQPADSFPVNEIIWDQDENFDGTLSADVLFKEFTESSFSFFLTNNSFYTNPGNFPSTVMLTGFGFNLPAGYLLTGGVISGIDQDFHEATWNDYWGYANLGENDGGPFADKVLWGSVNSTVATLSAAVESPLDNIIYPGWKGTINGPNYGILKSSDPAKNWDYLQDAALITLFYQGSGLSLVQLQNYIESGYTVASYGSPELAAVPEPTTLLLLGFGLVGLAGISKSKLKK